MWKRPEEITAHNQAEGRGEKFDPAQWIHTIVGEVETLWLEGEFVILAGCCESVRVRREDVIAWREMPGRDGHPSTYQVRLREGAEGIAQRAVVMSRDQPHCPRCDRSWEGLPPARGRDENSPDERRGGERDHGHGHGGCRDHGGHGDHGGPRHHDDHGHHGHHAHHGHHGHHERHGDHREHRGEHGEHSRHEGHGGGHHYWHHAQGMQHHHHHGEGGEHHHHDE